MDGSVKGAVRGRGVAATATTAALAYAGTRLIGLVALAGWALATGRTPLHQLAAVGDARWYRALAEHGYAAAPETLPNPDLSPLAFFPLYPWLIRLADAVLPAGPAPAALLVSWTAALAAAVGLFRIGALLHGPRAGLALAVLWGALPHAVVESMAYTESLFTACAVWALYAAMAGRWPAASVLAVAAGLARPTGVAVALAVCAGAALAVVRSSRAGELPSRAPVLAAALVAPLGWCGYVLWAGLHAGAGPTGYFAVQRAWGSRYDFGAHTLRRAAAAVAAGQPALAVGALLTVAVLAALLVAGSRQGQPPVLLLYTGALAVIVLGGDGFLHSRPRFLLPAFGLLLPLALVVARLRTRTAATVLSVAAVLSALCGCYLLAHLGTAAL
ncbi:hypothetical protein AB0J38_06435 [Streptomyces sp. NPDC050095]|uniref:hypothetical protein n=1 Tax=unclassified Streptomyces TaxID=2593676 RepID=UPI0034370C7C